MPYGAAAHAYETIEVVNTRESRRTGRLVCKRSDLFADYSPGMILVLFGAMPLIFQWHEREIPIDPDKQLTLFFACIFTVLGGVALIRAWKSNELLPIADVTAIDLRERAMAAAECLEWDIDRENRNYATLFVFGDPDFGDKVVIILYDRQPLLINVRNLSRGDGVRWPLNLRQRQKVVDRFREGLCLAALLSAEEAIRQQ